MFILTKFFKLKKYKENVIIYGYNKYFNKIMSLFLNFSNI